MSEILKEEEMLEKLRSELVILKDKPEETVETTLKALWLFAAGKQASAKAAAKAVMPDLTYEQAKTLKRLVNERLNGVPLAHITGRQQFMGVELIAGPQALVPREETEILGKAATDIIKKLADSRHVRVIDVCTGSGNLAVALCVLNPEIMMYASDLSEEAVSLAGKNVRMHNLEKRVELRSGDLLTPFASTDFYKNIDLILCNPPYISSAKVTTMVDEISEHEPKLAFDGGPFGIKILSRLIKEAPQFLKQGGIIAFEVGLGQGAPMVKRLESNPNYSDVNIYYDHSNEIRALSACCIL